MSPLIKRRESDLRKMKKNGFVPVIIILVITIPVLFY